MRDYQKEFPVGTIVRCVEMINDPAPIEPGTLGIVTGSDKFDHLYVHWKNGRHLNVLVGIDRFEKVDSETFTVTAYPYAVTTEPDYKGTDYEVEKW